jgi:NTP pyrophosphatase (non-canonical NTP hydrolase)
MITHSELVRTLVKPGEQIRSELTADQAHLMHMVLGISGEAGEILDTVKKHIIYRKDLDVGNLIEEIGDLLFFVEGLCQIIEISPGFAVAHNIEKLQRRYANGYSDQAAQERADKQ